MMAIATRLDHDQFENGRDDARSGIAGVVMAQCCVPETSRVDSGGSMSNRSTNSRTVASGSRPTSAA